MKKIPCILKNETGSIIIFALMILALLTILGIAASRTANTEVQIAGNEIVYQRNFYLAEGAAVEAVDRLENIDFGKETEPDWIKKSEDDIDDTKAFEKDTWTPDDLGREPGKCRADPKYAKYLVRYDGVADKSSLGIDLPRLHNYSVYGRSEKQGLSIVKMGYRKAF